jgi:PAS domain S-box-containing protein
LPIIVNKLNHVRYFKTPALIVIISLVWAFIAEPLITSPAKALEPHHQDLFRSIIDFIAILIIGTLLYIWIRKRQLESHKVAEDYRRLFDDLPTPMNIFDSQTLRFLTVNNAAVEQYGYTLEEFLNLKITDIRPPEEVPALLKIIEHIPDNYLDAGRWLHRNRKGETFYVHVYTHCITFEGKAAKQVLTINIDQKVKSEMALKEKSEELVDVLESITDAFYTLDKDWNFTYVNKEFERILKRKRDDLLGKNIWELFPYGKDLRFFREYHRALSEQVSMHFEEYNPNTRIWVSAHAYPTKKGLAIYFRDVTEEKQIQEKIYNNEQNLRAIINNTRDLIWSVDKEFNIITGNRAFWDRVELLTGKTHNDITNSDFEQEIMKRFLDHYDRAFKGEAFVTIRQRTLGGRRSFEEMSFNPIYDQQKQVIGVNCFLRDITEQQRHLDRIEKQNQRLREIAWIQSHRVRAPVASILGLAQLCNLEDPGYAEIIPMLKTSAEQLDEVIREITGLTDDLIGLEKV